MTFHVASEPFRGIERRERISLGREWDYRLITIPANGIYSEAIDTRFSAGMAVSVDDNMTGTYIAIYASHEQNGAYRPVRDSNGTLLAVPRTAGSIMVFPAEVFPLGWVRLVSCSNATGTTVTEAAARVLVVHLKP